MARLRLGVAADFLSSPAMLGFMNGAAVVIVGSQIGKLCGIKLNEYNTLWCFWDWISRLGETHALTLIIGVVCLAVLALCRWKTPRLPGAVVVFVLAMFAGQFVNFPALGLHVIGVVDLHIPDAVRPGLRITDAAPLFTAAIGIALLVFSEGRAACTVVAASTTIGVIALGVLSGILLGVVLSLLGVLAQIVRPQDTLLGRVEGSNTMHDVGDDEAAQTLPGLVVYRFYGPLIFANVRFFIERIEWFIAQEREPVRQVILDARAIPSVDITAAEQVREFVTRL
jgi:MFS superfamily sulfate permease-like transporter